MARRHLRARRARAAWRRSRARSRTEARVRDLETPGFYSSLRRRPLRLAAVERTRPAARVGVRGRLRGRRRAARASRVSVRTACRIERRSTGRRAIIHARSNGCPVLASASEHVDDAGETRAASVRRDVSAHVRAISIPMAPARARRATLMRSMNATIATPRPDFDALEDEDARLRRRPVDQREDRDTGERDEGRMALDDWQWTIAESDQRRREREDEVQAEPVPSSVVATDHSVVEWIRHWDSARRRVFRLAREPQAPTTRTALRAARLALTEESEHEQQRHDREARARLIVSAHVVAYDPGPDGVSPIGGSHGNLRVEIALSNEGDRVCWNAATWQ